ncbi:ABC transporter permease [Streptacidiphilus fuscans]|uniref:ABC transporter permease n=1 Tax=Streptacidiphilus fuscans TaxID=2789292 RepID=A0A931B917_9ACTN|nr:ABC transporter permease [Streptacidiphilus fuscans]MBF9070887.1 ABC transporter permease [Streptacidiphilus fuscans]
MSSTDLKPATEQDSTATATATAASAATDVADLGAGLDALETQTAQRTSVREVLLGKVLPPVVAIVLVLLLWQGAYAAHLKRPDLLPSPLDVWNSLHQQWLQGTILSTIWTSLSRGILGFLVSVVIGTPIGLLVARVKPVRAAIGPILSGLQSIPSVAWVPASVIWFGLSNATIYAVVLLGAVPSIANGLVAGVDQVQPLYLRAGRTLGATGLRGIWHVLLPAALPGYVAGLKQGWAFSWRSLMAAELIASSPALGLGLGAQLEFARENLDMPGVLATIILILVVGIGIEMLVFNPIERRVLRSRGLLTARR